MCHAWHERRTRRPPARRKCHAWPFAARAAPLPDARATRGMHAARSAPPYLAYVPRVACLPHAPPPRPANVPRVAPAAQAQALDQTPCLRIENFNWVFTVDSFEDSSFMACPFGRKLLGQPVEVHISEQFEPADAGVLTTAIDLLGPRDVVSDEDYPNARWRPRRMTRGWGGGLRAADGWMYGIVTGWHDTRTQMLVTRENHPNVPMQGPAKTNCRGRQACYLVYHPWLLCSLWHNLDLRLYSLDPAAQVDHWRAHKRSEV